MKRIRKDKSIWKKLLLIISISIISFTSLNAENSKVSNEPDSAYIFAYTSEKNGLLFAWSIDKENWHTIGPEYSYVRCDYGRWGSQKRMFMPYLFLDSNGLWHCIWSVNEKDGAFAHAASKDLIYWQRQSYPIVMEDKNCLMPEVSFDKKNNRYFISWLSDENNTAQVYSNTTADFKSYTPSVKASSKVRLNNRQSATLSGKSVQGTVHKVAWDMIDGLIKTQQLAAYNNQLWSENSKTDPTRFASLEPIDAVITVEASKSKKISDLLLGVFFEDINYAADGGLYAEMIQNRDFEYALSDKEGRDKDWNSYKAWSVNGENITFGIDTILPIHPNNPHYATLQIKGIGDGLINEGFDGIAIQAGEKYNFSIFARTPESKKGKLLIRLIGKNGEIYGETSTNVISSEWKKYDAILMAKETLADARIEITPQMEGVVHLDMISLFPQKTFMNRKNGLRADLAQIIADMKPRFVRFSGGCVAHGDGIENIYRWENTVGSLESRKPQRNLWGYHQTAGLGYLEYFQFCEDIGAEPLPVVAAGVPCQNSAHHGHPIGGQQGGIPMEEMDEYIQTILDLIEWANGDAKTKWGKVRSESGHPKPFNLKYIGVGNEDLITDIFEERFTLIFNAIKEKYPDITVIGTVGPASEGTDYEEGWEIATKLGVPMVDEHYYQPPGWFIHNQDYYDKYDRSKPKVYLGEYAAHLPGRPRNLESALAEALYMTALERNGDVVSMSSYAPLLAKEGHTQWNPDLIYFNNTEVKPTVGYYVQKLYGQNSGNEYLSHKMELTNNRKDVKKRIALSVVRDTESNDVILKLVNLLPVAVKSTINLRDIDILNTEAVKTVLKGIPDDTTARPQQSTIRVSDTFTDELPAYSFTVIRIKGK